MLRETNVRQLLEAEASHLLTAEPDLGPRVAAALAGQRRRSRERRFTLASVAAGALMVTWLGAAPLGAPSLTGGLAVPRPAPPAGYPAVGWVGYAVAGTRVAAETPSPTATAVAPIGLSPLTTTATTTSTPLPNR